MIVCEAVPSLGVFHPRLLVLVFTLTLPACVGTALKAQTLMVTTSASRVAVGEQVSVRVEARLGVRERLLERMPELADSLPDGVRVVSADSLRPTTDGSFVARMRIAFFRPGAASVPALVLVYHTTANGPPDTLRSQPVPVEIVASLPPGNQPMRDIKDLEQLSPRPHSERWPAVAVVAALIMLFWYLTSMGRAQWRRRGIKTPLCVPPARASPFDIAVAQLAQIETARWPANGRVARHYEQVSEVLRRYLENAHGVRATDRTTPELVWSLPPDLSDDGRRDECRALLEEADLVKFARFRPDEVTAEEFLSRAHALLDRWRIVPVTSPIIPDLTDAAQ